MKSYLLGLSSLVIGSSGMMTTVACYKQQPTSVVFQVAQGQAFPLAIALKPFIKYYNDTFKDEEDFMKVKIQFKDDYEFDGEKVQGHGSFSEFGLIKNAKSNIESGDFKNVPNIILGAQSGAYIINQDKRLLDLSDKGIKKDFFFDKIADLHSVLAGQGVTDKIFNIPFDNADVDALIFNLRLLNKMFEIMSKGGGTISQDSEVIKKALAIQNKEIPTTSIWAHVELKTTTENKEPFKDFTVSGKTFKTIDGVREFAKKFAENIEIKQENKAKITDSTLSGDVLSIDYQEQAFLKELHTKIEDKEKSAFQLDQNKKVKYNLIDDSEFKKEFKSLWENYSQTAKLSIRHNVGASTKAFHAIKYMKNGTEEWGSWQVLKFQSAMSFAASVGAYQNKISTITKSHPYLGKVQEGKDEEFYKTNAGESDVYMTTQVTKTKNSKHEIFNEGGSSIIPIDSRNDKVNRATKKFLEWFYKGKNKIGTTQEEDNWYTFARTSGYVMPLKNVVKNQTLETFKKQIQKLEEKIKGKKDKKLVENKKLSSLHFKLNMLRSSSISLESLLKLNDEKTVAKAMVTDDKSAQMVGSISTSLLNQTTDKKSEIIEFNKLLADLESKKSQ